MKKHIYLFCFCFSVLGLYAQNQPCEEAINKAEIILFKKSPFVDQSTLIPLLEPCANSGNAQAENYLGMAYLQAIGTEKDLDKAFKHIYSAAQKGYANAQYNLGMLYKYGKGCELSFDKAIQWFKTATANGNQRAAFSLGYMAYKGFGVSQDYQQALYWFEKSTDPMAKHFLAICNYFGYGTPINEQRAVELLTANPTINSKTFLSYVEAEQRSKNEAAINQALQSTKETDSTYIKPEVITNIEIEDYADPLTKQNIQGAWVGKLVQYDWSGKHILRILPIELGFETNEDNNTVQITGKIEEQNHQATAQFQDSNLYIDTDVTFTLDKLYSCNPIEYNLDYTLFTLGLEKKTLFNQDYLIGYADTFIDSWSEYGNPMALVLKPKGAEDEIDLTMIQALAEQEDQFIKLYPVPFNNSLTVQYQLETTSQVFVELYSLHGNNRLTILPTTEQQAGEYTYTIPVNPTLPEGLYVVRLTAGNQIYTRMIIKNN